VRKKREKGSGSAVGGVVEVFWGGENNSSACFGTLSRKDIPMSSSKKKVLLRGRGVLSLTTIREKEGTVNTRPRGENREIYDALFSKRPQKKKKKNREEQDLKK